MRRVTRLFNMTDCCARAGLCCCTVKDGFRFSPKQNLRYNWYIVGFMEWKIYRNKIFIRKKCWYICKLNLLFLTQPYTLHCLIKYFYRKALFPRFLLNLWLHIGDVLKRPPVTWQRRYQSLSVPSPYQLRHLTKHLYNRNMHVLFFNQGRFPN